MANILDDICDDGPVLSPRLSQPKGITKRQVERCIHELSEHWSDEQLNDVVAMDQATPTRISKVWVRHRVEEVIGQLSTMLDDDQVEDMVQAFKPKGLISARKC